MIENKHSIKLSFDLPGFSLDDINVDIKEDSISIKAEKKEENKFEKDDCDSLEKTERTFSYFSTIPSVKKDYAKIQFIDNRLIVIIPKKK